MPQQPYHVYVDLDAANSDFSSKSPPLLRFDETRDYPFRLCGSPSRPQTRCPSSFRRWTPPLQLP